MIRRHDRVGRITWNRKLNGHRARPGRYRLTLTAIRWSKRVSSSITVRLL
jgi:hypothetical protein